MHGGVSITSAFALKEGEGVGKIDTIEQQGRWSTSNAASSSS
jgi:hypothetical protein